MKIQKKLFTLVDTWPWAIIVVIVAAVLVAAIHRYTSILPTADEWIKLSIFGLVALSLLSFVGARYDERYLAVSAWNRSYQTRQGTAIVPDLATYATIKSLRWYKDIDWGADSTQQNPLYLAIADEIDNCCNFWNKTLANNGKLATLESAFSGATLSIVGQPFSVNFLGKVMGTVIGQNIQVVFDGQKVQTEEQLIQLIRHECSHLCLTVLGIVETDEVQHPIMRQYNFG
jgi:hypothetical protein